MRTLRLLMGDNHAAGAAEFALVLPVLLLLLFGIIDGGRFLWDYNRAEKATQMGARMAAVSDMVADGLQDHSFATDGSPDVPAGDPVGTDNFDEVTCHDTACSPCTGSICGSITHDATAFDQIVTRMAHIYPPITPANVQIRYKNIGLGYAGNPSGPDISPLITVSLKGMLFRPITCAVFPCNFAMPDFRASLTAEDTDGDFSN